MFTPLIELARLIMWLPRSLTCTRMSILIWLVYLQVSNYHAEDLSANLAHEHQ